MSPAMQCKTVKFYLYCLEKSKQKYYFACDTKKGQKQGVLRAFATYKTPITMTSCDFFRFFVSTYYMTVSKTCIGSIDVNILYNFCIGPVWNGYGPLFVECVVQGLLGNTSHSFILFATTQLNSTQSWVGLIFLRNHKPLIIFHFEIFEFGCVGAEKKWGSVLVVVVVVVVWFIIGK